VKPSDESLGALDKKLREQMQFEIKELARRKRAKPAPKVTHWQRVDRSQTLRGVMR